MVLLGCNKQPGLALPLICGGFWLVLKAGSNKLPMMKRKYAIAPDDELKQAEVIRQAAGRLSGILASMAEHQGAWPMQSLINELNRTLDDIDELSNAIRFTVAVKAELLRNGAKPR